MNILKAQALKVGNYVNCPADRGEMGYRGRVEHVGVEVTQRLGMDEPYIWVTVRRPGVGAHASVWPSNRIG